MDKTSHVVVPPAHQGKALLVQANPVQDQWYTILDTTLNCRIYDICFRVATTGEDLEVRITVDGQIYTVSQTAVAGDHYGIIRLLSATSGEMFASSGNPPAWAFMIEGRSIKVDMRKTTAAGAGTLYGSATYGTW